MSAAELAEANKAAAEVVETIKRLKDSNADLSLKVAAQEILRRIRPCSTARSML